MSAAPDLTTLTDLRALEDGAGLDFAALRRDRLDRCLEHMERHGLDALVLGREGNARYVSGARRLWRAVITSHIPTCVLVARTRQVHLMNTWDDGIPEEIPTTNLWGLSWNAQVWYDALAGIEGLAGATRIGVDGMSTFTYDTLTRIAPGVELVDGQAVMAEVRSTKFPAEVVCVQRALAVAEGCLAHARDGLTAGVTEHHLLARFRRRMGDFGPSIAAVAGTVAATRPGPDAHVVDRRPTSRPIGAGDLVALEGGIIYSGYEGTVARTDVCPGPVATPDPRQADLHDRYRRTQQALLDAVRVGATPEVVREGLRGAAPDGRADFVLHGVGIGVESPWIDARPSSGPEVPLHADMTLALRVHVWDPQAGSILGQDVLHLGDEGPTVLSRASDGAFAG